VTGIDVTEAQKVPGVVYVKLMRGSDPEVLWQGDLIAVVVAETEGAAAEGLKALKITYDQLPVFVNDEDLARATEAGRVNKGGGKVQLVKEAPEGTSAEAHADQEIERLLKESAAVVEGHYGIQAITHMCLEPHGSTCEWKDGKLTAHLSTQAVSATAGQFAQPLQLTADDVTVHCDYIGGGFGSKFAPDPWGIACAEISKAVGRPVKFMLTRDQELKTAGCRPSGFIDVRVGADKDGVLQVWDSHHWGTAGPGTGGAVTDGVIPYVFVPPNYRRRSSPISTNTSPTRAWRAPNHPQACAMTQTAYDDIAAKLGIDSYDVFMKNLPTVANKFSETYAAQMKRAAELMDWKAKWHAHGKGPAKGSVVSGLGIGIHMWGGGGGNSRCNLKVHPDGGVEVQLGTQDLGTGTRTVIQAVVADTFGLPMDAVKVNIGSSRYPASGTSGGSTTVGGVSSSTRKASQDAVAKLFELVASKLAVEADKLEARNGRIQVKGQADKGLPWKEACSLLGMSPLEVQGNFERANPKPLSDSNVCGVQMAEVEVDKDTGVIKVKKYVAVQDIGLVINPKLASSQIYGAVIMGIAFSLFEERIMDRTSGAFVNAELADYRLPRLGDIGEIVVEFYEPDSIRKRGVIGLGEPPVCSPGGAISNAVCNALGVRVPVLPMTPKRVLDALSSAKKA
jgi:xanthine dehydrogenase YagR molybdenum-binding subunit